MKNPGFFLIAVVGSLLVFFVNAYVGMYLNFGVRHYWFTELQHLFGGFFIAMFFYGFSDSKKCVLFFVLSVAVSWELMEYLVDVIPSFSNFVKQFFHLKSTAITAGDTLLDLILDIVGAALFFVVCGKRRITVIQ